jgi:hypothetical protein
MKQKRYIKGKLRALRQEAVDLATERALVLTRLRNMAYHWDRIIRVEARCSGIAKTADKYGLEVSTVRATMQRDSN